MVGWIDDSEVASLWRRVCDGIRASPEGVSIDAQAFVDASLSIISIFDLISGMGVAKGDMVGNASTLRKLAEAHAPGVTLQNLVGKELASGALKKLVGDGRTATCALLWLVRALTFVQRMIEALVASDKSMKDCVLAGYERSLKPYHGMCASADLPSPWTRPVDPPASR